ncbi:MAG: hypothetical protein HRU18_11155 [Pseudoalteromonas sp.]|uniref:hypothetical protein n=1 Tax=Pseudoalteromonas sp. TaxID=53249 RepID=UPI001E018B49|nr:hypothetical protein [Pseudoalteromonas sp.]NRA78757.1 hypothetical protein [Pseudoalteromonas sp.]
MDNLEETGEPLLNKDLSIKYICFECLDSGHIYTVVGTELGDFGVGNAIDTLVRDDGERRKIRRSKLYKRFGNIKKIPLFYGE